MLYIVALMFFKWLTAFSSDLTKIILGVEREENEACVENAIFIELKKWKLIHAKTLTDWLSYFYPPPQHTKKKENCKRICAV